MPTGQHHFAVAGAGLAGLTAAVALAKQGHRVTVFEQSRHIGGRAMTEVREGFHLNLGPHALYRNGPAQRTLTAWGIPFSGHRPRQNSGAYIVDGGALHAFPADAFQLLTSSAFPGLEKLAAARAFQALMADPGGVARGMSIAQYFEEKLGHRGSRRASHGAARRFAEALVRVSTYAAQFDLLSARAALAQVQSAIQNGVLYLDGGWQTLIDGLAAKAVALGVEIRTGAPFVRGGIADGSGGGSADALPYSGTVLAIPPASVESLMGVKLAVPVAIRAACLDIALRSLPANAAVFALGLDQALYYSLHSAAASLAPAGAALIHVMKYLRSGEACDRNELEAFTDLLAPGWRSTIEFTRFLPNMTVANAIPGAENGAAAAAHPAVDALNIPGVMLAGDWVGDEGMLADAAVASALRAVEMLTERKAVAA